MFTDSEKQRIIKDRLNRLRVVIERRMHNVEDEIIKKICDKFGYSIFRRCSAPADFAEKIIKKTFSPLKIKTAIEIGTLNGITAAIMTQFVKKVHTIDIIDYKDKYKIWDYLGVTDKINFHLVKNELEKKKLIDSLDFDIAYSDGDHLHHTHSDFFNVMRCGRVLLHEIKSEKSQTYKLIKSLPEDEIKYFEFYEKYKADIAYWEKKC